MSRIVLLDSGPLGLVTNPKETDKTRSCKEWLNSLFLRSVEIEVAVAEIIDYEIRRELLRAGKERGLKALDELEARLTYLPFTTRLERKAAELWAQTRQQGMQTAPDLALDGDMFLAAQAVLLTNAGNDVTIATTNLKHLGLYADARLWDKVN